MGLLDMCFFVLGCLVFGLLFGVFSFGVGVVCWGWRVRDELPLWGNCPRGLRYYKSPELGLNLSGS